MSSFAPPDHPPVPDATAGAPLPACHAVEHPAPAPWTCVDFLSDLHLQAGTPLTARALIHHVLHTPAHAVFILGDLFEAWVGDELRFEGVERDVTQALREASHTRWLGFMAGNRDFLVGRDFAVDTGVHLLHDPTVLTAWGRRVLLTHGDLLCTADLEYQAFRRQVRNPQWAAAFLQRPLSERKAVAQGMRDASQARHAAMSAQDWADVDPEAVNAWMAETRADLMIHGHTHRPGLHAAAAGAQRAVLSDWDLDGESPRGDVLRLTPAGLERLQIAG